MSDLPEKVDIITPDEIRVIRQYITLASTLRADYNAMKKSGTLAALSKQFSANPLLDDAGVESLIASVESNTNAWPPLEQDMKALCTEIITRADNFKNNSAVALDLIQRLPSYEKAPTDLEDLNELELQEYENFGFWSNEDTLQAPKITEALDNISSDLETLPETTETLKKKILDFKTELMNTIQTLLRKVASLDTIYEIEDQLRDIRMSADNRYIVRGHMNNVSTAFSQAVKLSYAAEGKRANMAILDYSKSDYNAILSSLPSSDKQEIEHLVGKLQGNLVLTQHFASFHDALIRLDNPLLSANKGIGQVRTLWTTTRELVEDSKAKSHNLNLSTFKNIERTLGKIAKRWADARTNATTLSSLL